MAIIFVSGIDLSIAADSTWAFAGHSLEQQIEPPQALGVFTPYDLAIDNSLSSVSSGDLYVTNPPARVIDKFNSLGVYETSLTGTPAGTFSDPEGVAVDPNGDVYVTDTGKGVIDKFSSSGVFIPGSGGPSSAFISGTPGGAFGHIVAVATDSSGGVYVADTSKGVIDKFSSSGVFIPGSGGSSSPFIDGTPSGPFIYPEAVAIDPSGNVYVTDFGARIVDKFDSSGSFISGNSGPNSPFLTFVGRPGGVAVDNSASALDAGAGDIYITEASGAFTTPPYRVYAYDQSGTLLSILPEPAGGFDTPAAVAVSSNGRIYVSDQGEHNVVDVFGTAVVPDAVATSPNNVQQTSATLKGTVNPNGENITSCEFEYDLVQYTTPVSPGHGQTVPCEQSASSIGSGNTPVPVSAGISGLTSDTIYHVRLVVSNANGVNESRDGEFTTHGVPAISGEVATTVGKTTATLQANVNPHGFATMYRFEYGTSATYGAIAPIPDGAIGSGTSDVMATAEVGELHAGTIYHFRIVATNSAGEPVDGPDQTFETVPAARIASIYSAQTTTEAATLTAYIDPLGGPDTTYQFEYGQTTAYGQTVPSPDGDVGSGSGNQIVNMHVTGLASGSTYHFRVVVQNALGTVYSPDAVLETQSSDCPNAELRTGFSPALPDCRAYEMVSPAYKADYDVQGESLGVSPDGERAVFTSLGAFSGAESDVFEVPYVARRESTQGWITSATSPPPLNGRQPGLNYDYTPDLTQSLTVMISLEPGILNRTALMSGDLMASGITFSQVWPVPDANATIPEDTVGLVGASADLSHAVFGQAIGAKVGLEEVAGIGGPSPQVLPVGGTDSGAALSEGPHPINNNGSEIFFDEFFVRVNDSKTLTLPGRFAGASADGSRVFLVGGGEVLYTAMIDNLPGQEAINELVAITPGMAASIVRTSDDGSHVYFSSKGVFAAANAQGFAPQAGTSNLYVYNVLTHETKFIAAATVDARENVYLAQTTPDGHFLVFVTEEKVTPDDIDTTADVYRYDAETGGLMRVSMGENGEDENGNSSAFDATIAPPTAAHNHGAISEWRLGRRAISDDGSTIVFISAEPLSLHAVNPGKANIYVWQNGNVGMISTGHSQASDISPVVSSSGRDVFFITSQNVLKQDSDGMFDVYDARIDGGFATPAVPGGGCSGDSCQGPPSTPSLLTAPASATFMGAENPVPEKVKPKIIKCGRGYVRTKRNKCIKAKRKPKGHRKNKKHNTKARKK